MARREIVFYCNNPNIIPIPIVRLGNIGYCMRCYFENTLSR